LGYEESIVLLPVFNQNNSQIDLLRNQTTLIKGNAQFPILKIDRAIAASRKYAHTL